MFDKVGAKNIALWNTAAKNMARTSTKSELFLPGVTFFPSHVASERTS